jgi:hypothetical protein
LSENTKPLQQILLCRRHVFGSARNHARSRGTQSQQEGKIAKRTGGKAWTINPIDQKKGVATKSLKNKTGLVSNQFARSMFSMDPIHTLNR